MFFRIKRDLVQGCVEFPKPVLYNFAGESIEQRVVELQDLKKKVIRQMISDDDGSVTSASLEDIAFVLE